MSKKIFSVIMVAVLAAGSLTGCGQKSASDDGFTTIEMWSGDSHAKAVMNDVVKEFNDTIGKENKVKFVWTLKENAAGDELKIALQQGKEPDLITCYSLKEMAENNYIASLDDIPEIAEIVAKNSDVRMEGTNVYQGKMYLAAVSSQVYGLAYNKDMFKAAGIVDENGEAKPPETLDELREDAKLLTNPEKKEYGIAFPGKWGAWFDYDIGFTSESVSGCSSYNFETGKYDYSYMKPAMELVLGLKEDGSVYPGMEGLDNDPARARFAEGNIGMKFAVSWDVGVWNDQFKAKCDWAVAPLPVKSTDEKYYQTKSPSFTACISKRNLDEKGAEAVSLVFNYLYSDEILTRMYETGVYLPWRDDIIETVKLKNAKTGWEDFGNIVKISKIRPVRNGTDLSGYDSVSSEFLSKVWTGEMSIDEFITKRTDIANKGMEKFSELHPERILENGGKYENYFEEMKRQ